MASFGKTEVTAASTTRNPPANTFAIDINNSGVVVGYYSAPGTVGGAFWYKDGAFKDIVLPNAASSYAFGINSQQQVTGYAYVKGQKTPVRYIATCQ